MFSPTSKKRERNSSMSDAEVVFWSSQLRRRFTARIQSCMVAKWCQVKTKDPTPPTQSARLQWPWQTFNVLSPQHSISNYAKEHCPPDGVYIFCSVQDLASCGYPPLPQTRSWAMGLCVLCCMCYKNASAFQHFRPWKPEILALSPPLRGPSLPYLRRPGPNLMISGCTPINANLKNASWSEQGQYESACDLLSLLLSSCDPVPLLGPQSQVLVPRFV